MKRITRSRMDDIEDVRMAIEGIERGRERERRTESEKRARGKSVPVRKR